MSYPKRAAVIAVALATVLVAAGCAPQPAASSSEGIAVEHAFGETIVPADAERVVTLGWGSTDAAISLGVVPVAIPFDSYAGDDEGVLPWVREAVSDIDAELPTVLPDSPEEPPYDAIDAADPDVILAVYSGITEEQYDLLSEIAPVVAYAGEPWSTPWRDLITTVGLALDKQAEAKDVIAGIEARIADEAAAHPEFSGTSIAAVADFSGTFYVYRAVDPRVEFLLDLGFVSAPAVDELANGDATFYYTLSYEQLDQLDADVVLSYSDSAEAAEAFLSAPQTSVIPAVAGGTVAQLVGTTSVAAVSPPTALSFDWVLDELVEQLSAAAAQ